tara:strand:+ start:1467 stop:2438 length:972 start_codon:yes stop_codon:yes gene_type:complete
MKKIDIVIPVFNEEKIVDELISSLQKSTCNLNYRFKFIIVDDGSKDDTLRKLLALQAKECRLEVLKLSRNWGHQNAYNAGVDRSDGDALILMDGDLEDPPELIQKMINKWEEGNDVVYSVKETRQRSFFYNFMFNLFYKLLKLSSSVEVDHNAGMFSLIDRKVVNEVKLCTEKNKYYVGLRFFIGFSQARITYQRAKRFAGVPKQNFRRLSGYALDAIFSFSFLPIRLLTYFGLFVLFVLTVISIFIISGKIFDFRFLFFHDVPGWASVVLLILFGLGVQTVFIGILGEYIARIFDEVRDRPYYIVEKVFENLGHGKKESRLD